MPSQFSSADATLSGTVNGSNKAFSFTSSAPAAGSVLYLNGLTMTQPVDGTTTADTVLFTGLVPHSGDTVTVAAFIPDTDGVNAPTQFSTADGSLIGAESGSNNTFTLNTGSLVTGIDLSWNGLFMTEAVDYTWTCLQTVSSGPWITVISMTAGEYPLAGDNLTAQVYTS